MPSSANSELAKVILRKITPEMLKGLALVIRRLAMPVERKEAGGKWWQRPGIGIMYQVEYRPGIDWNRDFSEFNREMKGEEGRLEFNGPFCQIEEWVELSKEVGVDYHIMEIKWHDGICYFDTGLTDWKTEVDYAGEFAEMSRSAGIPLMYYYSAIFDHNPQFDPIQPSDMTASFIGLQGHPAYDDYIRGQYGEIMEQYRPDGMWIDWYWPDQSTSTTIDFFRTNYPDTVLTFNISNLFVSSYSKLDYTSGEAHDLNGPFVKIKKVDRGILVILSSAWKWSAMGRRALAHPSELVTPAGRWWQDPSLRDDPYDLVRMAAIVMACGGRLCPGVAAQLDGSIYPGQVRQLKILGDWYGARRELFAESVPLRYRGRVPLGMRVRPKGIKAIACRHGDDTLLHLVNMDGATRPIELELRGKSWKLIRRVYLEPGRKELEIVKSPARIKLTIKPDDVDPVDSILRLDYQARA